MTSLRFVIEDNLLLLKLLIITTRRLYIILMIHKMRWKPRITNDRLVFLYSKYNPSNNILHVNKLYFILFI